MNIDLEAEWSSVPLLTSDARYLRAAEGYIELGLYAEAEVEIENIDSSSPAFARVLALKLCIYAGLSRWELMQAVARKLAFHDPADAQWAIWWAYAVGKSKSVAAAQKILQQAADLHPNDPRIHYSLSGYEIQLDHIDTARRHLARAIQLDFRLKRMALRDEDLRPLWPDIREIV